MSTPGRGHRYPRWPGRCWTMEWPKTAFPGRQPPTGLRYWLTNPNAPSKVTLLPSTVAAAPDCLQHEEPTDCEQLRAPDLQAVARSVPPASGFGPVRNGW